MTILLSLALFAASALPTTTPMVAPSATATSVPAPPTPAPTAVSHPRVALDPTSIPAGTGATVNVTASGFPSGAHLLVSWQTITGTAVLPGTPLVADGSGYASRGEMVPRTVAPGTYRIIVAGVAGVPEASASITLEPPVGATGTPGEFCFIKCFQTGDWWRAAAMGLVVWWHDFYQAGMKGVVTPLVQVALYLPVLTASAFSFIDGTSFVELGAAAINSLVGLRIVLLIVGAVKSRRNLETALLVLFGLVLLTDTALNLGGVEAGVWRWVNDYTQYIGGEGMAAFGRALMKWTTISASDLGSLTRFVLGVLAAGALLLLSVVLFVTMVLTKLGLLAIMVLLVIVYPLALPTLATSFTRPIGAWCTKTLLAITACPILYAHIVQAGGGLADSFGADSGGLFANPVTKVALGVMLVVAFNAVPQLANGLIQLGGWGGAGALQLAGQPFVKHGQDVAGGAADAAANAGKAGARFIPVVGKHIS